jgi:NADPH:quinone reductase-like Zn-dependent oxidoreductase
MTTETNRVWQMTGFGLEKLVLAEAPVPQPRAHEILIRVGAGSLNYKDKMIVEGTLLPDLALPHVPTSDAAGEVVAAGSGVTRFRVGDRVVGHTITDWVDGDAPPILHQATIGMSLPGVLADFIVIDENAAVATPAHLSDAEASTLPIAALTAWFALFEAGHSMPGETVLIQGTGGVSLFAVQFAALAGLRAIVTSSSDEKLERAKALGAWAGINYRTSPNWAEAARAVTSGRGVDHVLEMVGGDNARQSLEALAADGRVSLIGFLGSTELSLSILPFMRNRLSITGASIGHRRAFERMNRAIESAALKPVIDRVYPFTEVPKAFAHLAKGSFGKIVIAH